MNIQSPPPLDNQMNAPEDAKKFFFTIKLIHFALVFGLIMFGGITLVVAGREMSLTPSYSNLLIIMAGLNCLATIGLSFVIPFIHRKITAAPTTVSLALQRYQTFCLIRWAVIEGGALFACVVILLTKNILPIILFAISATFLIYRYPSRKEFVAVTENKQGIIT